jgi:hypothetical protein
MNTEMVSPGKKYVEKFCYRYRGYAVIPHSIITTPAVLPYVRYRPRGITVRLPHSRGNYCGYRRFTIFPITVSPSSARSVICIKFCVLLN